MLHLSAEMRDAMVDHARRDHPDECCGVLVGRSGVAERVVALDNALRSPTGFEFEPGQWLQLHRQMDEADEEIIAVYHSHTATEAYPSRTDLRWAANTPGAVWLILSTRPELGGQVELRAFIIGGAAVTEQDIAVG